MNRKVSPLVIGKLRRRQKSQFLGVRVVDEVLHQAVVGRVVVAAGDGGQCAAVRVVGRRIHLAPLAISLTDTSRLSPSWHHHLSE